MKLAHIAYLHHAFLIFAILGAFFLGMVLHYNTAQLIERGTLEAQRQTLIEVYTGMGIRGLTETRI